MTWRIMAVVLCVTLSTWDAVAQVDDCNGNGVDDAVDIAEGTSEDCNGNGCPDECDLSDTTVSGSFFLTGHDPDFHAIRGTNTEGARNIIRAGVRFVTNPRFNPFFAAGANRFLFVESKGGVPSGHTRGVNGITAATLDVDFDHHDELTLEEALDGLGVTYAAIVVASDCGGLLRQAELDILNERSDDIISFLNAGGGLFAMSEGNGCFGITPRGGHFGFLPFVVSSVSTSREEIGYDVTEFGRSLGLTRDDINGNVSHNIFADTFGLGVVDLDPDANIVTLAGRGQVVKGGVSEDCNQNGVPDECEVDGNENGIPDDCEENCRIVKFDPLCRANCDSVTFQIREAEDATVIAERVVTEIRGRRGLDIGIEICRAFEAQQQAGFEVTRVPQGCRFCRDSFRGFRLFVEGVEITRGTVSLPCDLRFCTQGRDCSDPDDDGWCDECDNCPTVHNPAQWDTDDDGKGDACPESPDDSEVVFVRGDVNESGRVGIADVIFLLNFLFRQNPGEPEFLPCWDAADVNDDARADDRASAVGLGDAVYLLNYLFLGGAIPPAPFPECGSDRTADDSISCDRYRPCSAP